MLEKMQYTDTTGFNFKAQESSNKYSEENKKVKTKLSKARKGFIRHGGMIVSVLIAFIATFLLTNDFKLTFSDTTDIVTFVFNFAILMFCSTAIMISCDDTGSRAGMETDNFLKSVSRYNEEKSKMYDKKHQLRLYEFCNWYIDDELRRTRESMLLARGIPYEIYAQKFMNKSEKELRAMHELTKERIEFLIEVNNTKRIYLTPDMIVFEGKRTYERDPIADDPANARRLKITKKILYSALFSVLFSSIGIQLINDFNIETVATALFRILYFANAGFRGYQIGFTSASEDAVGYFNSKSNILDAFDEYCDRFPEASNTLYIDPIFQGTDYYKAQIQKPVETPAIAEASPGK